MPRRRTRALPPGIYERIYSSGRRMLWIDFRDQHGVRVQEPAGTTLPEAVRLLRQRRADVAAGRYQRGQGGPQQTLETYAARWLETRRAEGVRTVRREEQLVRLHVLPSLGSLRLSDIRPRDVAAWVRGLVRGGELAPKSILNAHGVLNSMLGRARFDELIADNPARGLPRGVLPKNLRRREVGAWTRDEVEALISDDRIPEDRRVAYAIAAFSGARAGEVAGLRWEHLDMDARPLWRWALRTQYEGRALKTDHPRDVPIHPELQRILAAWKVEGWARYMCRVPRPHDFVVPRRNGEVHSDQSIGAKAVQAHAAKIGLETTGRSFHSFRRSMITLARTDGARVDLLERITHNAGGAMIDAYTYFGWDALCSAVSCVRIAPRRGVVVPLRSVVGDADGDTPRLSGDSRSDFTTLEASPAGFEPASPA